jgi:SAM-dependent methyltransferase
MSDYIYVGSELDLFSHVHNWKAYWSKTIRPYIKGDVLEAGAGIGSNSSLLDVAGPGNRFVCMEPDPGLAGRLSASATSGPRPREVICGTLQALPATEMFDTILYIDVLEHIEDDAAELVRAAAHLRPGGRILAVGPAHQWLFAPFDAAVGHFRRYNCAMVKRVSPPGLALERCNYLDSLGMALSASNRLLLKQSMPTKEQLSIWDRFVVPVSLVLDKLLFHSLGKSFVAVWKKPGGAE